MLVQCAERERERKSERGGEGAERSEGKREAHSLRMFFAFPLPLEHCRSESANEGSILG